MPAQRRLALLRCVDSERVETTAEDIKYTRMPFAGFLPMSAQAQSPFPTAAHIALCWLHLSLRPRVNVGTRHSLFAAMGSVPAIRRRRSLQKDLSAEQIRLGRQLARNLPD